MNSQEITPADKLTCPRCQLSHIKRNRHNYYCKQNYQCLLCVRQFVRRTKTVSEPTKELIKRLLLERISLRGICRMVGVSLSWLLISSNQFIWQHPKICTLPLCRKLKLKSSVSKPMKCGRLSANELINDGFWLTMERRTRLNHCRPH